MNHAVNVDECDGYRNEIPEQRLHPVLHLQAGAGIGFVHELVPTPAEFIAAEQRNNQGAQRQNIGGNYEIPEIQPGGTFCKRLEASTIVQAV